MDQQPGPDGDGSGMDVYGAQGAEGGAYNPADGGGDGAEGDGAVGDGSGVEFVVLNDDVLTSVANATLVLLDGSDMERLAVLYQFPQFLEHCPSDTLGIMVPEICRDALQWKEDVQMAAAEALYFVVNMRVPDAVAKRVVVAALRILQLSESGDVFDAWGEILSMMLPQVRRDDVVTLVVPATADRAASGAVESRRLAARIIGALHDALTADELARQFLATAITLSQDADASVRAMIAQSLASVASKLPLSVSETQLWPRLDTMVASDPNARVRAAALCALARSAEAHKESAGSSTSYGTIITPLFLRECTHASAVAATDLRTVSDDVYLRLECFAEVYGVFLAAVDSLLPDEDSWTVALNALRRMVMCNGPTVRHWCAFNMPAVALAAAAARPERLRGIVQLLATDTDVETRATLAAGVHETARLLAPGPLRDELLDAIAELMTDQNPQVRTNALRHFATLLKLLADTEPTPPDSASAGGAAAPGASPGQAGAGAAANGKERKGKTKGIVNTAVARQLAPIFESLELMSQDSWRTQELLAVQLKLGAHLVPQDTLCEHVAPLLFQMARESTYLVRKACMEALVAVMRAIPDTRRREHIVKHFRIEWARGKVYWTRLAYIDGAAAALTVFSRSAFVSMFAGELLRMTRDAVPNVRLRLVRLLVDVGPLVRSEPKLAAALDGALAALSVDSDAEVAAESREASRRIAAFRGWTKRQNAVDRSRAAAEAAFFIQKPPRRKKTPSGGAAGGAAASGTSAGGATGASGAVGRPAATGVTGARAAGQASKSSNGVTPGVTAAAGAATAAGSAGNAAPGGTPGVPNATAATGAFVSMASEAPAGEAKGPLPPGAQPGATAPPQWTSDTAAGATGPPPPQSHSTGQGALPGAAATTPNGVPPGVAVTPGPTGALAKAPLAGSSVPAATDGPRTGEVTAAANASVAGVDSRAEARPRRGGLCGCFGR
ncbi:hypothetical protein MMPV_008178 [Pyropia vietnamensis]